MATAQDIIDRVEQTLNDIGQVRWTEPELLKAIDDAQQALLEAKPDLFEDTITINLVEGTEQEIPATAFMLFDVLHNIDSANVQGRGITKVDRAVLDRHRSSWSESNAHAVVRHWAQDDGERKTFFVAPRQPSGSGQKVRARVAVRPTAIAAAVDDLSVPDEKINDVYHFTCARALEKDSKFSGHPQAQYHMNLWAVAIGARQQAEEMAEAKRHQAEDV